MATRSSTHTRENTKKHTHTLTHTHTHTHTQKLNAPRLALIRTSCEGNEIINTIRIIATYPPVGHYEKRNQNKCHLLFKGTDTYPL